MALPLGDLRFVRSADVYKQERRAGSLARTAEGAVEFRYDSAYVSAPTAVPVASTLPLAGIPEVVTGGGIPAFLRCASCRRAHP